MTNQLEAAREWLSDLNKIIDKTDNECTKEKRDVLEWLVESVEELEQSEKEWIEFQIVSNSTIHQISEQNNRYRKLISGFLDSGYASDWVKEQFIQALDGDLDE